MFPDYHDPMVTFDVNRTSTWGKDVRDTIMMPLEAFAGWRMLSWFLLMLSLVHTVYVAASFANITLIAKLYNTYDEHLPEKLSSSVKGAESAQFFVNSRVVSLTVRPNMTNSIMLAQNPLQYIVELKSPQDDRPFRKGAVVCVWWRYRDTAE